MKEQLVSLGISPKRIFSFETEAVYEKSAHKRFEERYDNTLTAMTHKEVHSVQLGIMKEFKLFCESNNLKYFLNYGTLLGAVRHHGFVPWDNDVDVLMPWEDYQSFLHMYPGGGRYELLHWRDSSDYWPPLMALGDNETVIYRRDFGMATPCFIEIWALLGYPEDNEESKVRLRQIKHLKNEWFAYSMTSKFGGTDNREYISRKLFESISQSRKVFTTATPTAFRRTIPMEASWFEDTINLSFESEQFRCPIGWDKILNYCYGDYMEPPSEEERIGFKRFHYWKGRKKSII